MTARTFFVFFFVFFIFIFYFLLFCCPLILSQEPASTTWSPLRNVPGYQGQQEIVCLVGCKRASLREGGGLNGMLSPRRKENHWISSLTVRFTTTKSPVKLPCELCCIQNFIILNKNNFLFLKHQTCSLLQFQIKLFPVTFVLTRLGTNLN